MSRYPDAMRSKSPLHLDFDPLPTVQFIAAQHPLESC